LKYWKPILATVISGATAALLLSIVSLPGKFNHGAGPALALKAYTVIAVDPAIYDRYVGKYQLGPEMMMTVTREGDRLFQQLSNRPKREIFPFKNSRFFFKDIRAEIIFLTEGDGRAMALELEQFGKIRGTRIE